MSNLFDFSHLLLIFTSFLLIFIFYKLFHSNSNDPCMNHYQDCNTIEHRKKICKFTNLEHLGPNSTTFGRFQSPINIKTNQCIRLNPETIENLNVNTLYSAFPSKMFIFNDGQKGIFEKTLNFSKIYS